MDKNKVLQFSEQNLKNLQAWANQLQEELRAIP